MGRMVIITTAKGTVIQLPVPDGGQKHASKIVYCII